MRIAMPSAVMPQTPRCTSHTERAPLVGIATQTLRFVTIPDIGDAVLFQPFMELDD
jgi:hypothetical protein